MQHLFTTLSILMTFCTAGIAQHSIGDVAHSWNAYHLRYCKAGCTCPADQPPCPSQYQGQMHRMRDSRVWTCDECGNPRCFPRDLYQANTRMIDRLHRTFCITSTYSYSLRSRNDAAFETVLRPSEHREQLAIPRFGINRAPTLHAVRDELDMLARQCLTH